MFVTSDNQKIVIYLCYLKTVPRCFNKCKWDFYREEKKKCREGEQSWLVEKNGGWQGGRLVKRCTFPTCHTCCSCETIPFTAPPTQHLVSLFCIKVRSKDTMGHLAAPPEERCGEVTGMVDEYVGKSSSGRRKNQLVSTEKSTSNGKLLCCCLSSQSSWKKGTAAEIFS